MGHTQPAHSAHAPGAPTAPGAHSQSRTHVAVAIVLALLTVVAFGMVWTNVLPTTQLLPALLILALAQVVLQTLFYMRLRFDSRKFAIFFGGGVVLAVLISTAVKVLLAAR